MNFPRAFLIAEIGINHNGDMALAEEMIRAAADAGADAVKFLYQSRAGNHGTSIRHVQAVRAFLRRSRSFKEMLRFRWRRVFQHTHQQ